MTTPSEDYRLIPLTQGQFAKVSPHRFEELNRYNWFAYWDNKTHTFRAVREIWLGGGKRYSQYMHRQILGLIKGDRRQVDHKNHDTLDNRDDNLRICSPTENGRNHRKQRNNTTGYIGVYQTMVDGKLVLQAKIRVNKKIIHLGTFPIDSAERAAKRRDEAATFYFGEFAHLNFP